MRDQWGLGANRKLQQQLGGQIRAVSTDFSPQKKKTDKRCAMGVGGGWHDSLWVRMEETQSGSMMKRARSDCQTITFCKMVPFLPIKLQSSLTVKTNSVK